MPALIERPATVTADVETAHYAVHCQGLTKEYGTGDSKVQALRGVDMEVNYGEMTLLIGQSGCGKTTLISIIAGLLNPTSGTIEVLNNNLTRISSSKKTRFRGESIGFVFQQYNLLPSLNAAENAAIPLMINGWDHRKAIKKATECLELVGLGSRARSLPNQLSGGQQQRVAIARSLVIDPRLLVCDEPTAALDAKSGQIVMQLLREVAVQKDRAVIVVTHDNRVFHYGDRIFEMEDGHINRVYSREEVHLIGH